MPSNKITSLANHRIKNLVSLREHKNRIKTGLTIIEGEREIERALEAGVILNEAYVCVKATGKELKSATHNVVTKIRSLNVPIYELTEKVFAKIAYGNRSGGILATGAIRTWIPDQLKVPAQALFVLVERVEKPGNLGAILRTCDAAGVHGVFICNGNTDVSNPNVIRASLGTVFSNRVIECSNQDALDFLKAHNISVCAAVPQAKNEYTKHPMTDSVVIVLGSEEQGLSEFWIKHADRKVRIPMYGRADSLNVSATAAILLYEILRQRTA